MTPDDIVQALDLPAAARVDRRVPKTLLAVVLAVMSSYEKIESHPICYLDSD